MKSVTKSREEKLKDTALEIASMIQTNLLAAISGSETAPNFVCTRTNKRKFCQLRGQTPGPYRTEKS